MKHVNIKGKASRLEIIRELQKESRRKTTELYLAKNKHRSMKKAFRGIQSYPNRKILFKVGQSGTHNSN